MLQQECNSLCKRLNTLTGCFLTSFTFKTPVLAAAADYLSQGTCTLYKSYGSPTVTTISTTKPLPFYDITYKVDDTSKVFEYFEEPNTAADACTHLESEMWDMTVVAACKLLGTSIACLANSKCNWNVVYPTDNSLYPTLPVLQKSIKTPSSTFVG